MYFTDFIFRIVWEIADWFWWLYYESKDIPIVGSILSNIFYWIYKEIWNLLQPIAWIGDWMREVQDILYDVITLSFIQSLFKPLWDYLLEIGYWFENIWTHVYNIIEVWWDSTEATVKLWINEAVESAVALPSDLLAFLTAFRITWSNFTTITLPNLADWTGINNLLKTWFADYTPFWEGWQDWKGQVIEFFTDPLEWLYNRLDDFFERFW